MITTLVKNRLFQRETEAVSEMCNIFLLLQMFPELPATARFFLHAHAALVGQRNFNCFQDHQKPGQHLLISLLLQTVASTPSGQSQNSAQPLAR